MATQTVLSEWKMPCFILAIKTFPAFSVASLKAYRKTSLPALLSGVWKAEEEADFWGRRSSSHSWRYNPHKSCGEEQEFIWDRTGRSRYFKCTNKETISHRTGGLFGEADTAFYFIFLITWIEDKAESGKQVHHCSDPEKDTDQLSPHKCASQKPVGL